jgi:NitT/TauT family transport system permease protein
MVRIRNAVAAVIASAYPIVLALVAWEAFAQFGAENPRLFPGLGAIAQQTMILLRGHQLGPHLGASMTRVALGFGLAVVAGVPLGMLMGRSPRLGRTIEPLFSLGYPVPRIALYPIAVFMFGIGHFSKVILVGLECLYPIAIQTYYGTRNVNRLYIWSARNMGATPAQVFWRVIAPAAAPHVFSGLRIALPIAFIVTVLTEMVSSTEGLGWLILYASASLVQARVFASVLIVAAIGFAVDRALAMLRNRLISWERETVLVTMR